MNTTVSGFKFAAQRVSHDSGRLANPGCSPGFWGRGIVPDFAILISCWCCVIPWISLSLQTPGRAGHRRRHYHLVRKRIEPFRASVKRATMMGIRR